MRVTITGVKRSEYGKEGARRKGYNYSGTKEYPRYDQENCDCEGVDVIKEFSSTDFDIHPGDVVDFIYEPGYQDKATLVDVQIVSIADNPFPSGKDAVPEKQPDGKDKK